MAAPAIAAAMGKAAKAARIANLVKGVAGGNSSQRKKRGALASIVILLMGMLPMLFGVEVVHEIEKKIIHKIEQKIVNKLASKGLQRLSDLYNKVKDQVKQRAQELRDKLNPKDDPKVDQQLEDNWSQEADTAETDVSGQTAADLAKMPDGIPGDGPSTDPNSYNEYDAAKDSSVSSDPTAETPNDFSFNSADAESPVGDGNAADRAPEGATDVGDHASELPDFPPEEQAIKQGGDPYADPSTDPYLDVSAESSALSECCAVTEPGAADPVVPDPIVGSGDPGAIPPADVPGMSGGVDPGVPADGAPPVDVVPVGGPTGRTYTQYDVSASAGCPGVAPSNAIVQIACTQVGNGPDAKYTPDPGEWCADFSSWVYEQAGIKIREGGENWHAAYGLYVWGQQQHLALPGSATPAPGDLAIWGNGNPATFTGALHVSIVVAVKGSGQSVQIETVGGNEGNAVQFRPWFNPYTQGSNGPAIGWVAFNPSAVTGGAAGTTATTYPPVDCGNYSAQCDQLVAMVEAAAHVMSDWDQTKHGALNQEGVAQMLPHIEKQYLKCDSSNCQDTQAKDFNALAGELSADLESNGGNVPKAFAEYIKTNHLPPINATWPGAMLPDPIDGQISGKTPGDVGTFAMADVTGTPAPANANSGSGSGNNGSSSGGSSGSSGSSNGSGSGWNNGIGGSDGSGSDVGDLVMTSDGKVAKLPTASMLTIVAQGFYDWNTNSSYRLDGSPFDSTDRPVAQLLSQSSDADKIAVWAYNAGFGGADLTTIVAIAGAESSFKVDGASQRPDGQTGYGPWHMPLSNGVTQAQLTDTTGATGPALPVWKQAGQYSNFDIFCSYWSDGACGKKGGKAGQQGAPYLKFVDQANAAIYDIQFPGPNPYSTNSVGNGWASISGKSGAALAAAIAYNLGLRGQALIDAVAIAGAESGWDPNQVSPSSDYGMWQINSGSSCFNISKIFDPVYNGQCMYSMSSHGTNWAPWCTAWVQPVGNCGHGYLPNPQPGSPAASKLAQAQQVVAALVITNGQAQTGASFNGKFVLPIHGASVSQKFGCTTFTMEPYDPNCPTLHFHSGIDMATSCGTTIFAAAPGTVQIINQSTGFGYHVVENVGNGWQLIYGHMALNSATVASGVTVTAGQPIGQEGSTGNSTGCHLHFEADHNGTPQDPAPMLP